MKKPPLKENLAEFLQKEYIENKRTMADIAEEFGKSEWWVANKLRTFNIQTRRQGGGLKVVDLNGERFGKYTVVKKLDIIGNAQGARWQVICDCGNVREVLSKHLRLGQATSCGKCKPHYAWKGIEQISGQYISALKNGAKKRNIEYNIPNQYLWDLYVKQNKKCKISGLDIFFARDRSISNRNIQTASLDRIDSTKGYLPDNVQWVHKLVNVMKWNLTDECFLEMCSIITNHQKNLE